MDSCRCHFLYAPAPLQLTTFYAILQMKTTCVCMTAIDIFYTIVIDNLSCTITINDFCMYYWNQQILYALMLLTIFYALLEFTTFLCTNAFAISYVAKTSSRWLFITTYINITTNLYIVCNLLLTDTVNCRAATAAKNAKYDNRMFL